MKKRIVTLCIVLCAICFQSIGQTPVPPVPVPNRLVNDFAGILTADQIQTLENKLRLVDDSTAVQLAVVTIKELVDVDKADFTTNLIRQWGVGRKTNSGVVLLISMDHKWFIGTGYGMEGELPDITCVNLGEEYLVPRMREGKYYEAIDFTTTKIMETMGMMSWQDREKARAFKAAADKRDADIAAQKRAEAWQSFLNILAILVVIAFPITLFFLFRRMYREYKKERFRRKELVILINKNTTEAEEILTSIKAANKKLQLDSIPTWAKTDSNKIASQADECNTSISQYQNQLLTYTKRKVKESEESSYKKNMTEYLLLVAKIKNLQTDVQKNLLKEIFIEDENKRAAIFRCNEKVKQIYVRSVALEKLGYKLPQFKLRELTLENEFKNTLQQEEKLGKELDNTVDTIVEKLSTLLSDIELFISAKEYVEKNLSTTTEVFTSLHNDKYNTSILSSLNALKQKYPQSAWMSANSNLEAITSKKIEKEKLLAGIFDKNSMSIQKFDEAKADLDSIIAYNQKVSVIKRNILDLESILQKAKQDFADTFRKAKTFADSIQNVISQNDVTQIVQQQYMTLVSRLSNMQSLLNSSQSEDWISQLTDINSIFAKLQGVKKSAEKDVFDAKEERARKKRQKEQEAQDERNRIKRQNDAKESSRRSSSNSNSSSRSFSFGGGSSGGGGGGGTW